jgi:hypothetical protein
MRDYPALEMREETYPPYHLFMIDPIIRGLAAIDQQRDALREIEAWCHDQFGAPTADNIDQTDMRWWMSDWACFSFGRSEEATAFKIRWL